MSETQAFTGYTDNFSGPARRHGRFKRIVKTFATLLALAVIGGAGFLGWRFYENIAKATGDKSPLQLLGLFTSSQLNETNGRTNVLLAGYSVDDPGHQGAELTDSIMVVSINPQTKNAVLISIPRDSYVNIPGFGYEKINAAYEDGQAEHFSSPGYPNGGMGLLEEVVDQDFGVQTNYYGLLDYTAFKDAVNALGGVTVTINSPDPRGLYDPNTNLKLPNGPVALDGQQALNLARARGDGPGSYGFPDGDFDRTMYQQALLVALKNKATQTSTLTDPIKLANLADAIGDNFKTDMTLGVMETLYSDAKGIQSSSIKSVTLNDVNGQDLLTDYVTPDGEDALIPAAGFNNFSQIQSAIQGLLNNG